MRTNLITGLDIGATKTCAVIGEVSGEPRRQPLLKICGVGSARTTGVRGELITNIEATTEAVRQALEEAELMAGATVERVYTGIAGEDIDVRQSMGVVVVPGDEVSAGDMERVHVVARAVALHPDRELLHAIPTDYQVDDQSGIKHPIGMAAVRLETEVHLVACSATAAANIRKAVGKAGYGVQELVLEPLAAAHAVLAEDEKEIGVAMVDLGGAATEFTAYRRGRFQHVAAFDIGGDAVTADLVKRLGVPWAEAQKAKEFYGVAVAAMVDPTEIVEMPGPAPGQLRNVSREMIAQVAEQRLEEILGLVRENLDHHGLLDELGAGLVVTGGSAAMPGVAELAQQIFPTPVRVGVPSEGLTGLADSVARPRFATAVGLALHGLERFAETGEGASTVRSGVFTKVGSWLKEFF